MRRVERPVAGLLVVLATLLSVAFGVLLFFALAGTDCQYIPPENCDKGGYVAGAVVFLLPVLIGGLWIAWRVGCGRPLRRRPRLHPDQIAAAIYPPQRPPRLPAVPRPLSSTRPAVFVPCPGCSRTVNLQVGRCPYCQTTVEGLQ